MRSTVIVDEPETFEAWVNQNSPIASAAPQTPVQS
jgi:heme/copper-type cytochrome/quinol oxidase subunit 2